VGAERCAAYWAGGALVLARALHLHLRANSAGHPSRALKIFFERRPSRWRARDHPTPASKCSRSSHLDVVWSFGVAERCRTGGTHAEDTVAFSRRKKLLKQKKDTRSRREKRFASDGQGRGRVHVHPGTHDWRRCSVFRRGRARAVPIPQPLYANTDALPGFLTSANHARTAAVPPGG
jgi:hypothetical protein